MPQNSQGTIAIVSPIAAEAEYVFAPQDTYCALTEIPVNGTTLFLPPNPSDGDRYEWADVDGSCSTTHPILINGNGLDVQGVGQVLQFDAFSSGYCWFDADSSSWVLSGIGTGATWHQVLFTATGTMVAPAEQMFATLWGGGGGGGGGNPGGGPGAIGTPGAGGGGGSWPVIMFPFNPVVGETLTCTVGTGGNPGIGPSNGAAGALSNVVGSAHGSTYAIGNGASGGTQTTINATAAVCGGGGAPITSQGQSPGFAIGNLSCALLTPGQGGHGGTVNLALPLGAASAGLDNIRGPFGGNFGATGVTNTNAGGGGGGGGGGGPGGQGGNGGAGGAGQAAAVGLVGANGTTPLANSGAGGGGGGSQGNGNAAGAATTSGGSGASGQIVLMWLS